MKFSEFPFMRYTLFFMVGILFYPFVDLLGFWEIAALTSSLFITYLALLLLGSYKGSNFKLLIPLLAYLSMIAAGIFFTSLKDAKNDPFHLLYQGEIDGYLGVIDDLDQKKPNTFANRVLVSAVRKEGVYKSSSGEVIIYHKLEEKLVPGDVVWVQGNPSTVPPPTNPSEFNYTRFLANQQIFHSHYVGDKIERIGKRNHSPINNFVLQIRATVQEQMDLYIPTPHSNQIAKALLLGQNKYIEKEVSEAYVTAGTMHVLAVSGLHVGIIYGFFFLFIKPYQLPTRKRILYLSFVISIIWLYALITGMSPSVMRAATMFTLMALAQMKSRSPSIYNSLALSALILLTFDPYILFSVGFQLSYAAVFGIVLFQPKIVELWQAPNKVVKYFWEITTVGLAAQLATFPISVHYFHVFPTYFMLSNLIAIPGAFLIMSFGIPFMLLSLVEPIGRALGGVLDFIIRLENGLIFSFQNLPLSRIENINFPTVEMMLFWSLIISVYLLAVENKRKYAYLSLSLFVGLIFCSWLSLYKDNQRNELYVYEVGEELAVDHFYRGRLYSRIEVLAPQDISYKILPNRISKGHVWSKELKYHEDGKNKILFLPGNTVLQFDEKGFEIETPYIRSVSQYEEGKWLTLGLQEDKTTAESSYRVIIR